MREVHHPVLKKMTWSRSPQAIYRPTVKAVLSGVHPVAFQVHVIGILNNILGRVLLRVLKVLQSLHKLTAKVQRSQIAQVYRLVVQLGDWGRASSLICDWFLFA